MNSNHPKNCVLIVRDEDDIHIVFGNLEQKKNIACRITPNSQLPLITVDFSVGEKRTRLAYDFDNYKFTYSPYMSNAQHLAEWKRQHPGLEAAIGNHSVLVISLTGKTKDSAPTRKGAHPDHLASNAGMLAAWKRADEQMAFTLIIEYQPHLEDLCAYLDSILTMRSVAVEGQVVETSYWWLARQSGYTNTSGQRLTTFRNEKRTSLFPYWLATKWELQPAGIDNIVHEAVELQPLSSFHNPMQYELVMGCALLWERGESIRALTAIFDGETRHTGRLEPFKTNQSENLAYLHVYLTRSEDGEDAIVPEAPLSVKVYFNVGEGKKTGLDDTVEGGVCDEPTTADFVILCRLKRKLKQPWDVQFRLGCTITTESVDRMSSAVAHIAAWGHSDRAFPTFDAQATALAHGPLGDPVFGPKVKLLDLVPVEQHELCKARILQVQQIFSLDESQMDAFQGIMNEVVSGVALIQGPGGTGKTRVNSCLAVAAAVCGLKVLVCAASNGGVDALMAAIAKIVNANAFLQEHVGMIVRFQTPFNTRAELIGEKSDRSVLRNLATVAKLLQAADTADERVLRPLQMARILQIEADARKRTNTEWLKFEQILYRVTKKSAKLRRRDYNEFDDLLLDAQTRILQEAAIIGSTLNNCAAEPMRDVKVALLIGDEAAQALEADFNIAFRLKPHIVVQTGDHRQLGPTVTSMRSGRNPYARQLGTSLFQRLVDQGYKVYMLKTNYRMHPQISEGPNKQEYEGQLINHPSTSVLSPIARFFEDFVRRVPPFSNVPGRRLIVIDVPGNSVKARGSPSWMNPAHIEVMEKVTALLLEHRPEDVEAKSAIDADDLSILAPYKAQKREMIRRMIRLGQGQRASMAIPDIKIATVDEFQGRESEILLFDFTGIDGTKGQLGFMVGPRRLNMALTRAKAGLIIILDYSNIVKGKTLENLRKAGKKAVANFIEHVGKTGSVVKWPLSLAGPVSGPALVPARGPARGSQAAQIAHDTPAPPLVPLAGARRPRRDTVSDVGEGPSSKKPRQSAPNVDIDTSMFPPRRPTPMMPQPPQPTPMEIDTSSEKRKEAAVRDAPQPSDALEGPLRDSSHGQPAAEQEQEDTAMEEGEIDEFDIELD